MVLNILSEYLGEHKARSITRLAHGYELELPIQCVPDLVLLLCKRHIAVYQVVRYAKTDRTWV